MKDGAGRPQTHGAYSLKERGMAALEGDERELAVELLRDVETVEGIDKAIRENAVVALLTIRRIHNYLAGEIKAGTPLDELAILKSYPSFQNMLLRALLAAKEVVEGPRDAALDAELEKIDDVIGTSARD